MIRRQREAAAENISAHKEQEKLLVRLSDDNASVDEMRAKVEANPNHEYKLVGVVS